MSNNALANVHCFIFFLTFCFHGLVDVSGSRNAVVIHVPYKLRKAFRKFHVKLVRELEKKFSGKEVILRPPKKGHAAQRPRNRTLTDVHEAMLEDIVLPAEIIGKRIRYRVDGSKIIKWRRFGGQYLHQNPSYPPPT